MIPQQQLQPDNIPAALTEYDHWVCWETIMRDDEPTKRPIDPTTGEAASTTDPTTWGTLSDALDWFETADVDGIGFVFHESDPFVGIDLDKCHDPVDETTASWASSIITLLGSYTERSPSGTGFHILLDGEVPGDRNRKGNVEMYDTARYFTVTGDRVPTSPPSIMRRPKSLTEIYEQHLGEPESARDSTQQQLGSLGQTDSGQEPSAPSHEIDLPDQELIEKARSATNGDDFAALWQGSTAGYDSHSEADMALACHLSFWTGGDASRMDALFRDSNLMRVKWDEPHYADGSTYGQKTIERALTKVTTYYDPDQSTTETAPTPTIDELVAEVAPDEEPTSESDPEQTAVHGDAANRAEAASETAPPRPAEQPHTEGADLATLVSNLQAMITTLDQQLAAQQQTIDELQATIETIQARLDQRTQSTDENLATDSDETSDT